MRLHLDSLKLLRQNITIRTGKDPDIRLAITRWTFEWLKETLDALGLELIKDESSSFRSIDGCPVVVSSKFDIPPGWALAVWEENGDYRRTALRIILE